ncbi:MAG: AMP-binding protein [Planctomycetota bacterium]|nr:AMP-binding protein [Planctomycetota bacterium]
MTAKATLTKTCQQRREIERLSPAQLAEHQLSRINHLLGEILPHNRFYSQQLKSCSLPLESLEQFSELPYTFKDQLLDDRDGTGFATNLTYPSEQYCRFHRTSGTRGKPLVVLDTAEDWNWWIETWQYVYDVAEIGPEDRLLMAFSFGPFIGFWSAFDAAVARGALVCPTGGLTTLARIELIRTTRATAILCTPSYALHMAEVAAENQIDTADLPIERILVAGEPGGSIPAVRDRIQTLWNARVIDHSGATEVGPWGYSDPLGRGIYVNEGEFIAEFLSVEAGLPAGEGELSELVLTTLGRAGSPVIRYRTGDLVRPTWNDDQECQFVLLEGGVLGRTDDMMIIRGVNIFPSSIEQILRSFPEIIEYRMTARKQGAMDELVIEIEDRLAQPERVVDELQVRLGLRVNVELVEVGTLPRFEAKGKRFVDKR